MLLLWAQLLLHMLSWEPNYPVRCELIVAITPYKFCFSFPCIFVMCGTTCSNTQVKYKGLATPCVCSQLLHRVFATTGTRAWQAPLSREFCRQEYWGRLPFSTPGDLPHPGIKPAFLHWQADSLPLRHLGSPLNYYVLLSFTELMIFNYVIFLSLHGKWPQV